MKSVIHRTIGIVTFVAIAFMVWGGVNQLTTKSPASVDGPARSMELGTATPQDGGESESKVILNDPAISQKWGLQKMDAVKAWDVAQGSRDIIVAVIDTGIDVNHMDLKNNLWVNPGESGLDAKGRNKASNGVDDDGNGFIDDVHGWNFVHENHDLTDNHGHGTHIAGIIGAEGGNGVGISGVSPKVSLMVLKYYDPRSTGANNLTNTVRAIEYAIQQRAHIINYSGGGLEYSHEEFEAVQRAERQGILFVAAAGNERSNSDQSKYYPADYDLKNIISVTAVDPDLQVLPSSNYGEVTVDVAAPGQDIFSTLPGNGYGMMTGTSQATAFVSGVAALVMSHNREFNANHVRRYLLATGDEYPWLRGKTGTSKKLNIYKALTTLGQGVGATGVIATNTTSMRPNQFISDPQERNPSGDSASNLRDFGQTLLRNLQQPAPLD